MRYLTASLLAAFWAALVGILEGRGLELWFGIQLHRAANYAELALNYGVIAVAGALAARLALDAGTRLLRRDREPRFSVEFLVAGALLAVVALSFLAHEVLPFRAAGVAAGAAAIGAAAGVLFGRGSRGLRMGARVLFLLLAVVVFALPVLRARTAPRPEAAARDGRPDVLLVLVDTLRPDFLSCYGYPVPTSPHTDALAAGGARFTRVVAQASWTLPSTASLLTGLYPSTHGAVRYGAGIADEPVRLAEVLNDAGYRTAAFTENWYITPRNGFGRGFESFWGYWFPWVHESTALHRILRRAGLPLLELTRKREFPENPTDPAQLNWDARVTVDKALRWLDRGDGRPTFLYLHLMGPHGPYGPPEYLLGDDPPPVRLTDHPRDKGGCVPLGPAGEPVSAEAEALIHRLYAADIRYVDEHLGRLFERLRSTGRFDSTLILVTSDHGEEFYEHGAWNHGASAYEEVVRVPLIVSWPGVVPAQRVVTAPARSIDIMPTVIDLVGSAPLPLPGRSLRGDLTGGADGGTPDAAFIEACALRPAHGRIDAAVQGNYKLIRIRVGNAERRLLFDLAADPGETVDLAGPYPALADSLSRLVTTWSAAAAAAGSRGRDVRLDPATRRLLESLGYVN